MHLTLSKNHDKNLPRYLYKSNFSDQRNMHTKEVPKIPQITKNFQYKAPPGVKQDDLQARLPKSTSIDVHKYYDYQFKKNHSRQVYEIVDRISPSIRRKYETQSKFIEYLYS